MLDYLRYRCQSNPVSKTVFNSPFKSDSLIDNLELPISLHEHRDVCPAMLTIGLFHLALLFKGELNLNLFIRHFLFFSTC
jgi:hypothetical protein